MPSNESSVKPNEPLYQTSLRTARLCSATKIRLGKVRNAKTHAKIPICCHYLRSNVFKSVPQTIKPSALSAYLYMEQRQWKKAIADYDVAINSIAKIDIEGRTRRGYAYRNLKEYDKAIEDFTKVIEAQPKDAEAYRRRAYAYTLAGQNEKAATDLKVILKMHPNDADAKKRLKALPKTASSPAASAKPAARAKPAATPSSR